MRDGVASVLSSNHVLFWDKWMKRVVKERGKWRNHCRLGKWFSSERYRSRAGVMSRHEGEEEEELFVWMVFLYLKARDSSRVTVVREGISDCEDGVIGNTLQSDGTRTHE